MTRRWVYSTPQLLNFHLQVILPEPLLLKRKFLQGLVFEEASF
jgi:hypothetical protein